MDKDQELNASDDLQPILSVLREDDAKQILQLKEELADNWNKKQIFRTETEMRVSVLNDAKHPTPASKYWQAVREMSAHFDAMMNLSFDMRRNHVKRLKLERKMQKAIEKGDELKQLELQIDLDQNLYGKACMEQVAHDRVREIQSWSKIKSELDDGSFDNQNVNTHQAAALRISLKNRAKALPPTASDAERINALGPLSTVERLTQEDGSLMSFPQARLKLHKSNNPDKE